MKRIFPFILSLLLVLSLFGCKNAPLKNSKDRPPDIPTAFTADLYIINGEREYEAKYDQTSLTEAQLEFTSPATVRDLKVKLSGSTCTFSYGNLTFSADLSSAAERGGRADNKNAQNFVRHGEYTDRTYGRRVGDERHRLGRGFHSATRR